MQIYTKDRPRPTGKTRNRTGALSSPERAFFVSKRTKDAAELKKQIAFLTNEIAMLVEYRKRLYAMRRERRKDLAALVAKGKEAGFSLRPPKPGTVGAWVLAYLASQERAIERYDLVQAAAKAKGVSARTVYTSLRRCVERGFLVLQDNAYRLPEVER